MKNSTQIFKTLLVLSAVAMLSACAPRNQKGSSDSSSRVTDAGTSSKAIAYCNQGSGSGISAKLKYYKDLTGMIRMEYTYVRLTTLPEKFKSDVSYISMWKWLAVTGSPAQLDSSPLNFMLINPQTNLALTGWKTSIRWADVKTAAAGMGYTDAAAFFNAITILVDIKDAAGEYDALKISNYDISNNQATSSLDALLPIFHANPADYATESNGITRAMSLQNLHPFKAQANQDYSSSQFAAMANSLCF